MGQNRMPGERLGRHTLAAAEEGRAADRPALVDQAVAAVADLPMAGEVSSIGGAAMVASRPRLPRATARTGNQGVADAPTTAVTLRGAATHGPVLLTGRDAPRDRGDRP